MMIFFKTSKADLISKINVKVANLILDRAAVISRKMSQELSQDMRMLRSVEKGIVDE